MLGKTDYDQGIANRFVESGVGGCGWARPEKRPASLDAAPGQRVAPVAAPKKRGLFKRIRDRFTKKAAVPFVEPVPLPPIPPAPAPQAVVPEPMKPPPVRVDPVDALLHPRAR